MAYVQDMLIFTEVAGDLFSANCSLGHCISADQKLGRGIAKDFELRFQLKMHLASMDTNVGETAAVFVNNKWIYNIITKPRYFHKPTYGNLEMALFSMKEHVLSNNVFHLALPQLGCGLDKLEWSIDRNIIKYVFQDCDMQITVFY